MASISAFPSAPPPALSPSSAREAREFGPVVTRRAHGRLAVDLDVSLGSEHNFYAGLTENLSVGGVFVATHLLRGLGEAVEICVHLPDRTEVRAMGQVCWVRVFNAESDTPPGMGLRFLEIAPESRQAIETFARQREPLFFEEA